MLSTMRIVAPLAVVVLIMGFGDRASVPLAPSTGSPAAASPSPAESPKHATPLSAGAVPEAGVVYLWGADDGIYRYDGATGALAQVWGASPLARESAYGPYVLGRHGGTTLLRWDGTTQQVCSGGGRCRFRRPRDPPRPGGPARPPP